MPLVDATLAAVAPVPAPIAPEGRRRRVLVVDDNEDAAELTGDLLRTRGHEVLVAHDPLQALAVVDAFRPEIALLDIGLPVMNGYELATKLRARFPACTLIALTGYGQEADATRARDAGFATHIVKPASAGQLLELVARG